MGIACLAAPIAARLRGPAWCREALAVSLAAQVGVTPVLLLAFGSVPLVTPVANLLAAPAAGALGAFGMLASIMAGVVPALGPVVQPPSAVLVAWVSGVARTCAAVPIAVDRRGALAVVAIAAGAGAWSLACRRARRVPDRSHR
jgi:competence protein ComEC